jgi:hypothetical protein
VLADFCPFAAFRMVSHATCESTGTGASADDSSPTERGRKVDDVFLSPPWAGPENLAGPTYSLAQTQPEPAAELFRLARLMTRNVAFYVPRNTVLEDIAELLPPPTLYGVPPQPMYCFMLCTKISLFVSSYYLLFAAAAVCKLLQGQLHSPFELPSLDVVMHLMVRDSDAGALDSCALRGHPFHDSRAKDDRRCLLWCHGDVNIRQVLLPQQLTVPRRNHDTGSWP